MKTSILKMPQAFILISLICSCIACSSCSKDEDPIPGEPINPEANTINDFINNLDYDANQLLGVEETGGEALLKTPGETTTDVTSLEGERTTCVRVDYNLKANFEDVAILRPTRGIIWPGALVVGNESMRDGLPEAFTLGRAPMTIRLDLPGIGEAGNIRVEDPINSNVQAKIDEALEYWNANAYDEGYTNPSNSSYAASTSYSSKQMSLEVGMNTEWATGDVSAQFNYETTSTRRVAIMVFKQVFYTITMDTPNNPAAVFGADVSLAQVENAFNSSTPPAYVHSVNYGRIIMFRMETTAEATEAQLTGAFNYASGVTSASGTVEAKYKEILNESNITTVTIGGNAAVASEAVSAQNFGDLQTIIKGENATYSRNNPGVPIAYTIRFLKDNSLAKMGYSTNYVALNCTKVGVTHNQIIFTNNLADNFRVGIEYKNNLTNDVSYDKIDWKFNTTDGAKTAITPPNGAYDIFYHVERDRFGDSGYESKLVDNIGGHVHDYEDCFESYRDVLEVKVRACQ
ncbi:thiol-activated cytolysin family protein [Aquimarina sp. 2201CG14-23]|uniref:thiol-activated cytolysin family protein n=1 Tax=Aquimarina mycalae TaxID=3040073 RepID=UPI002477DD89|nr:thiol-activated cytolysin family protein [Aquimarina sp. 2201CG14-23]MDH7447997.1 thiol-activated cytolysin family protein [Aquimarina sp. 2201CG14-23]